MILLGDYFYFPRGQSETELSGTEGSSLSALGKRKLSQDGGQPKKTNKSRTSKCFSLPTLIQDNSSPSVRYTGYNKENACITFLLHTILSTVEMFGVEVGTEELAHLNASYYVRVNLPSSIFF